jgi:hypothetical protein
MNSWAVFTLLITTAYSSGLVSHLTVPTYSKPLDTIKSLVEEDIYWSSKYYPAMEILFDTEVCVLDIPVEFISSSTTVLLTEYAFRNDHANDESQ